MPLLRITFTDGRPAARLCNDEAFDALRAIGFDLGRWPAPTGPVSSAPQLTYARELLQLQQRHGIRSVEWVRIPPSAGRPGIMLSANELCVVIEGRLQLSLQVDMGRASLALDAGEWLSLPSRPPHTLMARAAPGLQLLRLHAPGVPRWLAA